MSAPTPGDRTDDHRTRNEQVTLRFGAPVHGWLEVELVGPEGSSQFVGSHVPGDSLAMLVDAARDLVEGLEARQVTWFLEPDEVAWRFRRLGDQIELVAQHDRNDAVRVGVASASEIGWLVWRALRRLETDPAWQDHEGGGDWAHSFPSGTVAALGERLRDRHPGKAARNRSG